MISKPTVINHLTSIITMPKIGGAVITGGAVGAFAYLMKKQDISNSLQYAGVAAAAYYLMDMLM